MRTHYIAATVYEGCGHKHRSRRAAARCLKRIDATHGKRPRVYKITERKEGDRVHDDPQLRRKP